MKTFAEYLAETVLAEQSRKYYDDWGWISPTGKYFDGYADPDEYDHQEYLKKIAKLNTYVAGYKHGWIRFFNETGETLSSFECENDPKVLEVLKSFIQHDPKHFLRNRIYCDIWKKRIPQFDSFTNTIRGESRAKACTILDTMIENPKKYNNK